MGNGIYSAVAGSVAQMRNLEVLANNLAHVDTPGYKADRLRFEQALDDAKATNFVATPGTSVRMSQGAIERTGNPLDVAIAGDGFFVVDTPQGQMLTRSGRFIIGQDGTLRTTAGHQVQGDSGPIALPPAGADGGSGELTIGRDGSIRAGEEQIGTLKRVAADPKAARKVGADLFTIPGGVGSLPTATGGELIQGHLEGANVNPVVVMTEIIEVQRTFDALQQAVRTYRDVDGQSLRRIGS